MAYDIAPILDRYGVEYDPDKEGNQQVCCVFHGERRPSASVNLEEGLFNCFVCDVRGDAIRLLELQEGIEFVEAKRLAEELAGEDRPAVSRGHDSGSSFLPRRKGHRPGRRGWVSPWGSRRS